MKKRLISTIKSDPRLQNLCLFFILLVVIGMYMYSMVMSVMNVVVSRELVSMSSEVSATITELESRYIEAQHTVRKEVALQHGFVSAQQKTFIASPDTALVISPE